MKEDFYVYAISGKCGTVLYVGKGTGKRYLSHLNGCSSNVHINRYFFSNGEDGCLSSKILKSNLTSDEALVLEKLLIFKFSPLFNIKNHQTLGSLSRAMEKFYDCIEDEDFDTAYEVVTAYPIIDIYMKSFGIGVARSLGFNSKKMDKEFNNFLNLLRNEETFKEHLSNAVKVGNVYTKSYLFESLQKAFDCCGVDCKVKLGDLTRFITYKTVKGGCKVIENKTEHYFDPYPSNKYLDIDYFKSYL